MSKNTRITDKERGLLKGAVRRVFSRSELRLRVIKKARIAHFDVNRPRVKKWVRCNVCEQPTAEYQTAVDHIAPLIPVDKTLLDLDMNTLVDRAWCEEGNLQVICIPCHKHKTMLESRERRKNKKERGTK